MLFTAHLEKLPEMMGFFREHLQKMPFSQSDSKKLELAFEEALVNIISYGYPAKDPGSIEIVVQHNLHKHLFEIFIKDWGVPFDPLSIDAKIDEMATLEERKLGGLGIYFITKIMDEVSYKRDNGTNLLKMVKKIAP